MAAVLLTHPAAEPRDVRALARVEIMKRRESDWRVGPVVYQVFIDRFAPSSNLEAKRALYAAPRRLMPWTANPQSGQPVPELGVWSHELDFWGGDIQSLRGKLDHVASLSDVLYLNPIHEALTNHKYDATHWDRVAPEFGTEADFTSLASDLHARGKRLVLDGVFNHLGRTNPIFKSAISDPASKYRDWFFFGPEYPAGYRGWANVANLPEVNLENPETRAYLWENEDSIVAHWLKLGADGWRLDVAHEIGLEYLAQITAAAHRHKPGSVVIGEVWNYPARWTESLDGLLSIFMGRLILSITQGEISPSQAGRALDQLIQDCGPEAALMSWVVLSNHDTPRLATNLDQMADRDFARALQFTLPGAPLIYYGDEIGMPGGGDPQQRAPMQWSKVSTSNPDLISTRRLVELRRRLRALRIGDYRSLATDALLGFIRTTEKPLELVIVAANPSGKEVTETMVVPDPTLMGYTLLRDELSKEEVRVQAGTVKVTVPPKSVRILSIHEEAISRGQYKRMKDGD